jgi:hypothetical protein
MYLRDHHEPPNPPKQVQVAKSAGQVYWAISLALTVHQKGPCHVSCGAPLRQTIRGCMALQALGGESPASTALAATLFLGGNLVGL